MDDEKLAALAACDPSTYFSIVETLCRRGVATNYTCYLLCLPQLLVGGGHPLLMSSWQHYKAYTSAFASWVKSYLVELKALVAAPQGGDYQAILDGCGRGSAASLKGLLEWLMKQMDIRYQGVLDRIRDEGGRCQLVEQITRGGGVGMLEQMKHLGQGGDQQQPTTSTIVLVLLVLVSRAVAQTLEVLAGVVESCVGGEHPGTSLQSSSRRADFSSCSSSTTSRSKSSGSSGGSSNSTRSNDSSSGLSTRSDSQMDADTFGIAVGQMWTLSVFHYNAVLLWQKVAYGGMQQGSNSSSSISSSSDLLSSCAAAAGCSPLQLDVSEAPSTTTGQSSGAGAAAASPAAAAAESAAAAAKLPKRLSKLPQQGLPPAVVEYLEHIKRQCPSDYLEFKVTAKSRSTSCADLLLRVQDVVPLSSLLLLEVPLPLGCSNSHCTSLVGPSEVTAASKACSGCKVVRYCSRACQVAHWKEHKELCKRLQEQQQQSSEQQQQQHGTVENEVQKE